MCWTVANSCITGVISGRPSSVVTRVLTEKRQSPVMWLRGYVGAESADRNACSKGIVKSPAGSGDPA